MWNKVLKVLKWVIQTFTLGLIEYYEETKKNNQ